MSSLAAAALLALAVALSMAGIAAAAAPSPWRGPVALSPAVASPTSSPDSVSLAVNDGGGAVAAWLQRGDGQAAVMVATRQFGGPWRPAQKLAPAMISARPKAAIDPAGNVVVIWESGGPGGAVRARVRIAARGEWGPVRSLGSGPAQGLACPQVVLRPDGSAVAIWVGPAEGADPTKGRVVAASRPAGTGAWNAPTPISGVGGNCELGLDVNADGLVLASWRRPGGFASATMAPGGVFGPAEPLPGPSPVLASFALGPEGQQIALGPAFGDPELGPLVAAFRPPAGSWSTFAPVFPAGDAINANGVHVAFDGAGNATALWGRLVPEGVGDRVRHVVAAVRRTQGGWSAPRPLSVASNSAFPAGLAVGEDGTAVALWLRVRGGQRSVRAATRLGAEGSFGEPEVVAPFARIGPPMALGLSDDGVASALWMEGEGRLRAADRAAGRPDAIVLSAAQLLVNQRIAQAAVRRAAGLGRALDAGVSGSGLRPGALSGADFDESVNIAGALAGRILPPGPLSQIPIPAPEAREGDAVVLSTRQLLINQRIGQAGVRRANALRERMERGITGGDLRDGTLGASALAPGLQVAGTSADPGPAPASEGTPAPPGPHEGASVRLGESQLVINQRIFQAAIVRLNALRARLQTGLTGADVRDGTVGSADLEPGLR